MAMRLAVKRIQVLHGHLFSLQTKHVIRPKVHFCSAAGKSVLEKRKFVDVHGSKMSYLDTAVGDNVVLFLHGNPTSAYLWRNVIPHIQGFARCLAPDLIGMGHSDKLESNNDYTFTNHYRYLEAWMENVKPSLPEKIAIVCHDWGSGLGFHWCHQHPERAQALVHMESVFGVVPSWDVWPEISRSIFQTLRSPAGEELVLKKNFFVEQLLPRAIIRELTEEEMNEYRKPYLTPGEDRRPTLTWPREIAIATEGPENMINIVNGYNRWLKEDKTVPKLYVDAEPGFFSPGIRRSVNRLNNHKMITVKGLHFIQEDSPDEIGQGVASFLKDVYKKA